MILVTGHMGFVGKHLYPALRLLGHGVIGLDLKNDNDILSCALPAFAERVYHLAAETNALGADMEQMMRVNVVGTARLLDRYGSRVVLASSSMVNYPVTPYAISKLTCERMVQQAGAAVVRLCNLYGEGGHSVIDRFSNDEEIVIRGSGDQRRTYAPVEHAIRALLAARSCETTIVHGQCYTVLDIAKRHPEKPVLRAPVHPLDILEGVQL